MSVALERPLESAGLLHHLITQNVDSLHQRAGSRRVLDLHGRLDRVECLECRMLALRRVRPRAALGGPEKDPP